MTSEPTIPPVIGAIADDVDGTRLGIVAEVYRDDATGELTWLAITRGLHSTTTALAPAAGARNRTGRVTVAVTVDQVASAPRVAQSQRLGPDQERALRQHYGMDLPQGPGAPPAATTVADRAAVEVVRSAERLTVGSQVVSYRRAVLRVRTTTEEVLVPVTVTRQQAHVEYVDVDPASSPETDPSLGRPPTGATTRWITLTADEPVVTTRAVPVERVRLVTEWVGATQDLHVDLSHEVVTDER